MTRAFVVWASATGLFVVCFVVGLVRDDDLLVLVGTAGALIVSFASWLLDWLRPSWDGSPSDEA